jgi:hypothetical protein
MIDWKQFAEINGLSVSEFKTEILTAASAVAMSMLEENDDDNKALRFTCSDEISKIRVTFERVEKINGNG